MHSGSFRCGECPVGWTGDGKTCRRNENGACSTNICHPLATCNEMSNTVICSCPPHMSGHGVGPNGCTILNIDPCASRPCLNGGTCGTNGTSYFCRCPPGFIEPNCSPDTVCHSNPCQNGGSCYKVGDLYRCTCRTGFVGHHCENRLSRCGGVLASPSGSLKYPVSQQFEQRCAWVIRTNSTKVLNVTFQAFEMENASECSHDWLQINDGPSTASISFGRFCGSEFPMGGNIKSSRNELYLWFRAANASSRAKFELSWNTIDPVCGGVIHLESYGTIASPGSPGNYPPNRDCEWLLNAPEGSRIQLNFFSLYLENHDTCNYDYLSIYEGSSTEDPLLEKFCNSSNPAPYTAPSSQILIYFHSDAEGSDKGFQIHYAVVAGYPGCGGTYTATRGEFGSPILSQIESQIIVCEYIIRLPAGNRIELQFHEFNLVYTLGCSMENLKIFEGSEDDEKHLVGRWCGRNKPHAYKSESNVLRIKLYTYHLEQNYGFRASYQIVCGGVFEEEGEITSPLYPRNYFDDRVCLYEIQAPLDKAIKLEFKDFELEGYALIRSCYYDFVEIYDGIAEQPVGKYCGSSLPPITIATHNYMLVKFHTDATSSHRGFKAEFTFIDKGCGGILTKPNMTITPPINPSTRLYEHSQRCTWTIVAPPEHHIQLYWKSFELEESGNCYFDFVEIYDNYTKQYSEKSDTDSKVGRFCGDRFPPDILSTHNVVTIVFGTDESDSGEGFELSYEFKDSAKMCGGNYFAPAGILRSPGWPREYTSYLNCTWVLNVPSGNQIILNVKSFSLESTSRCYADYLEIRNGPSENSVPIGKYCGTGIPSELLSLTNQLYIRFETDSSIDDTGFEIEWDGTISGCGGIVTSYSSVITSPNYPQPYMQNAQCQWHIVVNKGTEIKMVLDIDLESHHSCNYDYLEIFEGHGSSRNNMGKYCVSDHPIELTAHSNEVFLKMVSDGSFAERGFSLRYTASCNVTLTDLHGVIESPNFPNPYPISIECEWTISAPKGNKISLVFSHFDLESYGDECAYDYVIIEDPRISKSANYCHEMPPVIKSESNITIISFVTDSSISASGFRLEYEIIGCVAVLTKPNGEINSPSYLNYYPNDIECKWHIEVELGNSLELTIFEMDIEDGKDCNNDGILVTSARNTSQILGRYCGKLSKNQTITINSHEVLITFYSNESKNGRGFKALYKSVPTNCGGRLSSSSGFVQSPNYPHNYDPNLECDWLIETSEDRTINLTFIELDMEDTYECYADVLQIYDSLYPTNATLLLKTCDRELPTRKTWTSSGSHLLISFKTDMDTEAKGFKLYYEENCGRTLLTNSSGTIKLDSNHKTTGLCVWTITSDDPGRRLTFVVTHLLTNRNLTKNQNLQSSPENCLSGSLEVFEGEGEDAPLKTKICSTQILPIYSLGSALTIKLPLDEISEFQGFYNVYENYCGSILNSYTGLFSSPLYPESYPVNIDCIWKIETTEGNSAQINFQTLDISFSSDCNEDYLEVRRQNESGTILGILCGQENHPAIEGPNIWLKFHSDNDNVGRGFLAQYQYAQHNEISGNSGSIGSPRYPSIRLFENPFSWRITAGRNYVIEIQLKDLNEDIFSYNTIYDGYDETANIIEYSHEKRVLLSNTNIVYIISYRGPFWIDWQSIPRSTVNDKNSSCPSEYIFIKSGQTFALTSPGYPNGYENHLSCNWTFLPEDKSDHVVVRFERIELEDIYFCSTDFVRVSTSKDNMIWKEEAKLCSLEQNTESEYHGNPYLKVEFITDFSVNKTGFSAAVSTYCGSSLTTSSGIINGTKYGSAFQSTANCSWQISVRRGRKVQLKFTEFDLPSHTDGICESYVLIKNGLDEDSPLLGKGRFCGNSTEPIPQTSSNRVFVKFIRKTFQDFRWTLEFEEVIEDCGQHINLMSTGSSVISSPNYPHIPNAHSECVWVVTAPAGKRISVNFVENFQLTSSYDCANEYVEIRNGATFHSKSIAKFCGSKPNTIQIPENVIQIKYFTNVLEPKIGFKAEISINKCGGSYHQSSGTIISENYPHGTPLAKVLCDYEIIRPSGSIIYLNFSDIHLPNSYEENCSDTNHLEIYSLNENEDGEDIEELILPSICGSYNPIINHEVSNNKVLIRYKIKEPQVSYRGFKLTYNSTLEKCGGLLNSDYGTLTSPGYPGGWNKMRRCLWEITVPKGRRIKVEIEDFDFPEITQANFLKNRITFYNNFLFTAPIVTITNELPQEDIYSSDNVMMIQSIMTINNGHRGFKLSYSSQTETICKGCLSDGCEPIVPPAMNLTSYYCEYQTGFNEGTLTLQITDFHLNSGKNSNISVLMCNYAPPLNIISYELGDLILKQCENTSQKIVSLPAINAKVQILKSKHYPLSSYKIQHKHHKCGGVYIFRGNLEINLNLNVSENYGQISCVWQVNTNNDEVGHFTITGLTHFKLDCDKEYLLVYNGPVPSHPLVDRYCREQSIPNITLANGVFLHYQTSNYNRNSSLNVSIKHPETCGGRLIYPFRTIDFRNSYKNNVECIWDVEDSKGYRITAEFVGRFYIESSNNCQKDFIQITDNSELNPTPPLRACGRDTPPLFASSSNTINILFRSDDQVVGDGFSLKFARKCGGLFQISEQRHNLHSPNYPRSYDPNLNCNYTFVAKENQIILLRFLDFQIETGTKCPYDNLTIYAEYEFRDGSPRTYCAQNSPYEIRHQSRITLIFQTDSNNQYKGFLLEYGLEDCGGVITTPTKIQSPKDKVQGTYSPNMNCIWNITAPEGNKIVIKFEELDFEYNIGCAFDRVEIFEGNRIINEQRRVKLCGNLTYGAPTIISVKQNKAIIYSHADNQDPSKGFSAVIAFMTMCDKEIELKSTGSEYILDDFSGRYNNSLDCQYVFKAPEDHHVQLEFISFHVAPCSVTNITDCTCDFVEIRDGEGPFAEPLGNFCGHTIPPKLLTTKKSAFVRFNTDSATTSTGFSLKVSTVENICGKTVFNLDDLKGSATIKYPGSGNYLPYMRCEWEVFSVENDVHLHFDKLDIQNPDKDGNCSDVLIFYTEENANTIAEGLGEDTIINGDYDNIHSFYSTSLRTQHEFCGNRTPHDYYTNSRKIFLKFISDAEIEKSGFKVIATKVEGCFKNYTSTQGKILMTGVINCEIFITTNENYSISLYYKLGDVNYGDVTCSNQKIEVFNLKSNKRIQQICGDPSPTNSLFTDTNQIKISFSSALYVSHVITYLASKYGPGCGGELFNFEGIFTSPFYPINARNNSDCRWDIRVPQNLLVALKFDVFDLGSKITCLSDYLQIIEIKENETEEIVRTFCGGDNPKFYLGERNFLSVRFRKTVNYDGTGWVIRFSGAHRNTKILED